jgi:glycosyltransferase involved in cell wall biosynthesis
MPEKRKLKILFIIPSLGIGGAEWQLYYLLKGLSGKLHELSLAVFYDGGALADRFAQIPGLKIYYLHKKSGLDFAYSFLLLRLVRKNRFDIVQAYNTSARLVGLVTAKWAGIPVTVMTERNTRAVYSSVGSRVYHALERVAMRQATVVVANSETGGSFCRSRGIRQERIRVIANGLDTDRLQPDKEFAGPDVSGRSPIIGMVARLFPQKDPDTFLHAARLIIDVHPKALFLLVGGGPEQERVQAQVKRLQLLDKVLIVGETERVADYIALMDIVVLTSRQSEGCPNAIVEAMAMRKPVVVTDVPGNRELVRHEHNGLIVQPQRPDELANAIIRLLSNNSMRERIVEQADAEVKGSFSMAAMIGNYANLYQQLATSL